MQCPACDRELSTITVADVELDVCQGGCGGIWFDQYEFRKFDEPREADALLQSLLCDTSLQPTAARRKCPRCQHGPLMMQHFFSLKREVKIDECPACAGIWLDGGELAHIHTLFDSEAHKKRINREYIDRMFDEGLRQIRTQSAHQHQSYRRFANLLRFLTPSYYLPGKQDGGAF